MDDRDYFDARFADINNQFAAMAVVLANNRAELERQIHDNRSNIEALQGRTNTLETWRDNQTGASEIKRWIINGLIAAAASIGTLIGFFFHK